MHGNVTDYAIEGCAYGVVGKLLILRLARRHGRLVIRLAVSVSLFGLLVDVAADVLPASKSFFCRSISDVL